MHTPRIFTSLSAIALALGVAACSGGTEEPVEEAAPEGPDGISAADGQLNLPAVSGNPGAAYFTLTNNGEEQVSILAADVIGAERTELHETTEAEGKMSMAQLDTVDVDAGASVRFERGGKHVMIFGLGDELAAGGETELTLTFENGDKLSFPVKILAAGDDGSMDHSAMDHSSMDHSAMDHEGM